jgi:nucleoside phosphorylase
MKKLLTFAHRGEAQAFFSAYNFKPVEFFFDGLFESEFFYLLITGEGPHNASEKTVSVLAKLADSIDEVFNLGVAGSLTLKFKKNDLVWIRSAFAHHAERLEFKSYTSPLKKAQNDCMTAYTRVLSREERNKLSLFANIVDRELWAVASAAQLFKLPFYAVKIISDDSTDNCEDICKFVKEEAPRFSEKLLCEFQDFYKTEPKIKITPNPNDLLHDPDFYFTTSQERRLTSLLTSLKRKDIDPDALNLDSIRSLEISPKDRTRHLLQFFNDELNPMAKIIRTAIVKKLEPLNQAGIISSFDPDFEQDWLQLSIKIQSSRDLEKIKNAFKIFSYEDFKSVLNGNIE